MTSFFVRTDPSEQTPVDDVAVLDFFPGSQKATVQANASFLANASPTPAARDLLVLGAAAYCADRVTARSDTDDAWTRDLQLELPVHDPATWPRSEIEAALHFLTGDRWSVNVRPNTGRPLAVSPVVARADLEADAVCLLSGGLDSLCGVIDLLEEEPERRLLVMSHYEGGQTPAAQSRLFARLRAHYGQRIVQRSLFLRPAPANPSQEQPLPSVRENTSRSRSLLFLTAALALASCLGPGTPVYLPENGYIGVNVPLTPARASSFSTRTTHPHFLQLLQRSIHAMGIGGVLRNPYRLRTKGEMLITSRNPALLGELAPLSVSCSHPETARYARRQQGNCGYCFPCLVRRAAMAQAGWDHAQEYAWDALSESEIAGPAVQTQRGSARRRSGHPPRTAKPGRTAQRPTAPGRARGVPAGLAAR